MKLRQNYSADPTNARQSTKTGANYYQQLRRGDDEVLYYFVGTKRLNLRTDAPRKTEQESK